MYEILNFDEALLETHLIVDVRTPLEYEEDHIPGAINVPLLTNDERVEIGTLYKQSGPHPARVRALELTAHRFPTMIHEISAAAGQRPILVYCWRGGLRSRTVASLLDLTGFCCAQLTGGYKAYRARVTNYFDNFEPPGPLVVIHGLTGIGKTDFLVKLAERNLSIIDLEGLACHRGSAFGELGLTQSLSQKRFESLLWDAFRKVSRGEPVILEGESRRIGRISLPGTLYDVMKSGIKVWCSASLEKRVERLIAEYGKLEYREEMVAALGRIRKKLGGDKYTEIYGYLDQWELEPFMRELMVSYYDRLYYKTKEWSEDFTVSLENVNAAVSDLICFLATYRKN